MRDVKQELSSIVSSIHGLGLGLFFLFLQRKVLGILFILAFVFFFLLFVAYFLPALLSDYNARYVTTKIKLNSDGKFALPTVTICNQNPIRRSDLTKYRKAAILDAAVSVAAKRTIDVVKWKQSSDKNVDVTESKIVTTETEVGDQMAMETEVGDQMAIETEVGDQMAMETEVGDQMAMETAVDYKINQDNDSVGTRAKRATYIGSVLLEENITYVDRRLFTVSDSAGEPIRPFPLSLIPLNNQEAIDVEVCESKCAGMRFFATFYDAGRVLHNCACGHFLQDFNVYTAVFDGTDVCFTVASSTDPNCALWNCPDCGGGQCCGDAFTLSESTYEAMDLFQRYDRGDNDPMTAMAAIDDLAAYKAFDFVDARIVGCYVGNTEFTYLLDYVEINYDGGGPESCFKYCFKFRYMAFGCSFGDPSKGVCMCGNTPMTTGMTDDASCIGLQSDVPLCSNSQIGFYPTVTDGPSEDFADPFVLYDRYPAEYCDVSNSPSADYVYIHIEDVYTTPYTDYDPESEGAFIVPNDLSGQGNIAVHCLDPTKEPRTKLGESYSSNNGPQFIKCNGQDSFTAELECRTKVVTTTEATAEEPTIPEATEEVPTAAPLEDLILPSPQCLKEPCGNHGSCEGSYTCVCDSGYGGGNCETQVNDCPDDCDYCFDGINEYECATNQEVEDVVAKLLETLAEGVATEEPHGTSLNQLGQDMLTYELGLAVSDSVSDELASRTSFLLERCSFDGVDDCEKLFPAYFVDAQYGICRSFNADEEMPMYLQKFGRENALRLHVDFDELEYLSTTSTQGVVVILHRVGTPPMHPTAKSYLAASGFQVDLSLELEKLFLAEAPYGSCWNSKADAPAYYYNGTYDNAGCSRSVIQQEIIKTCGCGSPLYPVPTGFSICAVEKRDCVGAAIRHYNADTDSDPCEQACEQHLYTATVSASTWPHTTEDASLPFSRGNDLVLNIYAQSSSYKIMEERPLTDMTRLLSDIGAFMGNLFGASYLSGIEIVVFAVVLLGSVMRQEQVI